MQPDLSPTLVRERLSEQVAGYIEGLVDSGKLQPGDRLPPERDLAETLHVGRGVIREAVKCWARAAWWWSGLDSVLSLPK